MRFGSIVLAPAVVNGVHMSVTFALKIMRMRKFMVDIEYILVRYVCFSLLSHSVIELTCFIFFEVFNKKQVLNADTDMFSS